MRQFWDIVIEPALLALRPRRVLEIGVDQGLTTRALLEFAADHGTVVEAIDPRPKIDVADWQAEFGDRFQLHQGLSLEVLPGLSAVDAALIDGDHNWHTVLGELRAIEELAARGWGRLPLIFLHDVGWPYARRDLYYDADTIPEPQRQPHERGGLEPGRSELVGASGFNAHLDHASREGGERNGVLTAVEDFLEGSTNAWHFVTVPGLNGLGILAPAEMLAENGRLRDHLDSLAEPAFLRTVIERVEAERISSEMRRQAAARTANELRRRSEQAAPAAAADDSDAARQLERRLGAIERALVEAPPADPDEAGAQARRLARRLTAAELREEELEGELGRQRRTVREAVERREDAEHQLSQLKRRLADVESETASAREDAREARRLQQAAAAAQAAHEREIAELAEARVRLAADIADARETMEQALEQARVRAGAAESAARELRERLEVREIESEGLEQQVSDLREALADARVQAEVARAHQAAAEAEAARLAAAASRPTARGTGEGGAAGRAPSAAAAAEGGAARPAAEAPSAPAAAEGGAARLAGAPSGAPPVPEAARLAGAPSAPAPEPGAPPAVVAGTAAPDPARDRPADTGGPPLSAIRFMDAELQAHADFRREYDATQHAPGVDPVVDGVALPQARNTRGFLRAEHDPGQDEPTVDVIVCVHNALDDVRRCLWSVLARTDRPFRLVVVNDGSDAPTTEYLETLAAAEPALHLIHRADPPHGYTIAANLGLRAATGDYLVLLNSDTIVTFGWLERIVACGESDPAIGILGPLSNAASHQSIPELRAAGGWSTNPLPPHATPDGVAKLLERVSPRARPRVPFINGFCYVVKRAVIDAIGYFDEERFASGYCEENDFSFRAGEAGFELAVVDDGYVFHAKSKSFGIETRKTIAKRNYEIFLEKHGRERVQAKVDELESSTALAPLRAAVGTALETDEKFVRALGDGTTPTLRVFFILPGLGVGGSGGSHSIYQEVHGMRRLGVDARIALAAKALDRARAAYQDAGDVFVPFRDHEELADITAGADIVSATHFKSVAMLADLRARRSDFVPAYYVQDYEPFFTPRDSADVGEATASYGLVEDCLLFAKTHWLCNIVSARHGLHVEKVEPSIDEEIYRVREERPAGPLRVAAMVRPRTPRRQPSATVAVLEELSRELGGRVRVTPFGCPLADLEPLTDHEPLLERHRGVLSRAEVAGLLGESDVFLDLSMYQAFGRTALEAMACGATAIVPRLGGVWEFLEHGHNGIAVDAFAPVEAYEALVGLSADPGRLHALQTAALATGARYCVLRAALSEYLLFAREHERRFGARSAA